MKRSPMPPRRTWLRRSPLARMSARRRRDLRKRAVVRAEVRERDGVCQGRDRLPHVECWAPDGLLDVHELKRRSHDREGWLFADRCVALCRAHHIYVTEHPEHGHVVGLVRWSWEVSE